MLILLDDVLPSLRAFAQRALGGAVREVQLVGGLAQQGSTKHDIDLLYVLAAQTLPRDEGEAAEIVTALVEGETHIDLDGEGLPLRVDNLFQVGTRYFHLAAGGGQEIVENTDWGMKQRHKTAITLARQSPAFGR